MADFNPVYGGTPMSAWTPAPDGGVPGGIGQPMWPIDPVSGAPTGLPDLDVARRDEASASGAPLPAAGFPLPLLPGQSDSKASASVNYNRDGVPIGTQANASGGETEGKTDLGGVANEALAWAGLPPLFDTGVVKGEGSLQSSSANAGAGSYTDGSGKPTVGVGGDATTAAATGTATWDQGDGKSSYVNATAKGPNVAGGANASDSTAQVGAQATAAEAAVETGTRGTASDASTRVGVSEGVGFAGRVHYGDADGDGLPEYGVGADLGPLSFDVKTEDPLRSAAEMAIPGLGAISQTAKFLGVDPLADTNLTQGASELFNGLFD